MHVNILVIFYTLSNVACQDLAGLQTLPQNVVAPDEIKNAVGAYGIANTARLRWQQGLADYIVNSGLLTDELQANERGSLNNPLQVPSNESNVLLDARILALDVGQGTYAALHLARGMARQAIGSLTKYAGDSSAARRGALYAFIAYSEVMLADFFCSGVPLSTWDFEADYTVRAGSTTAQVYRHAVALFDTALVLANDSIPISSFARVGKGRALLALGEFSDAADVVNGIPVGFAYVEKLYTCATERTCGSAGDLRSWFDLKGVSVSNAEGGNSTIMRADQRTASHNTDRMTSYGYPVFFPEKYVPDGVSPVVVASGIEAALIRAEAALHGGNVSEWLSILNMLRVQSSLNTLPPLIDPGISARADTLFAERGRWLFLTGHRQGDLRRWLRQDPSRAQQTVYPTGAYPGGIGYYGSDVTVPIDKSSEIRNPYFRGCLDRRP